MASWTLADYKTQLSKRFGSRDDLDTQIEDALRLGQDTLEQLAELQDAWFLFKDSNALGTNGVTVAATETIDLPTDFLTFGERGSIYVYSTSDAKWVKLNQDEFDVLNNETFDSAMPTWFSLDGDIVTLFGTPDAAYDIRFRYYGKDDNLSNAADYNGWSTHFPLFLLAAAGVLIAEDLQYAAKLTEFGNMFESQRKSAVNAIAARLVSGFPANRGD